MILDTEKKAKWGKQRVSGGIAPCSASKSLKVTSLPADPSERNISLRCPNAKTNAKMNGGMTDPPIGVVSVATIITASWGAKLGNRRRQKSAPSSVEARSGATALARELGEQE